MSISREELESELIQLYEVIDARDARIAQLEEVASGNGRQDLLPNVSFGQYEEERKLTYDLRDQLIQLKDENVDLRAQLNQAVSEKDEIAEHQKVLLSQIKTQKNLLDIHKRRLATASKLNDENRSAKRVENGHKYGLELENQTLRAEVKELEHIEEELVAEIEMMSFDQEEASRREQQWEAQCGLKQIELQECEDRCVQLESDIGKLRVEIDTKESNFDSERNEHKRICASLKDEVSQINHKLSEELNIRNTLEKEVEELRDKSVQGILRKENTILIEEVETLKEKLATCFKDKELGNAELKKTARILHTFKLHHEEKITEAVTIERQKILRLQKAFEDITQQKNEMEQATKQLRETNILLTKKLNFAEKRNSIYEEENGIKSSAMYQRKLESDIHRRDIDISNLNEKVSQFEDKYKMLESAYDLLKQKAGFGPNFSFSEEEMRINMLTGQSKLEAENAELLLQIEKLEDDRIYYMKQLRENAADLGLSGSRNWGLNAKQQSKVLEFANNLKNGKMKLPLDNQSSDLKKEVLKLTVERDGIKEKLKIAEKEIIVLNSLHLKNDREFSTEQQLDSIRSALNEVKEGNSRTEVLIEQVLPTKENGYDEIMLRRIDSILGEHIAPMSRIAQNQFIRLVNLVDNKDRQPCAHCQSGHLSNSFEINEKSKILFGEVSKEVKAVQTENLILNLDSNSTLQQSCEKKEKVISNILRSTLSELKDHNISSLEQDTKNDRQLLIKKINHLETTIKLMENRISDLENELSNQTESNLPLKELIDKCTSPIKDLEIRQFEGKRSFRNIINETTCSSPYNLSSTEPEITNDKDRLYESSLIESNNEHKAKMTATASTVSNLKLLLKEKNLIIEQYKQTLSNERQSHLKRETASYEKAKKMSDDLHRKNDQLAQRLQNSLVNDCNSALMTNDDYVSSLLSERIQMENKMEDMSENLKSVIDERDKNKEQIITLSGIVEKFKMDMARQSSQSKEDFSTQSVSLQNNESDSSNLCESRRFIELQAQLRAKDSKIAGLRRAVIRLKNEKATLDRKENHPSIKPVNLADDIDKVNKELQTLKTTKAKCIRCLKAMRSKADDALDDLDKVKEENLKLRKQLSTSRAELSAFKAKVRNLSITNAKYRALVDEKEPVQNRDLELKEKIIRLSRQNSLLRSKVANIALKENKQNAEVLREKKEGKSLTNQIKLVNTKLCDKPTDCKRPSNKIRSSQERNPAGDHLKRCAELESVIVGLQKTIVQLQKENVKLKQGFVGNEKLAMIEKRAKSAVDRIKVLQQDKEELRKKLEVAADMSSTSIDIQHPSTENSNRCADAVINRSKSSEVLKSSDNNSTFTKCKAFQNTNFNRQNNSLRFRYDFK